MVQITSREHVNGSQILFDLQHNGQVVRSPAAFVGLVCRTVVEKSETGSLIASPVDAGGQSPLLLWANYESAAEIFCVVDVDLVAFDAVVCPLLRRFPACTLFVYPKWCHAWFEYARREGVPCGHCSIGEK